MVRLVVETPAKIIIRQDLECMAGNANKLSNLVDASGCFDERDDEAWSEDQYGNVRWRRLLVDKRSKRWVVSAEIFFTLLIL